MLASPRAAEALRALGLDARRAGRWLRAETADAEAARAALRPLAVDWSVRPAEASPPRLFVSDMDSSVIGQECIDELADFAGRKAEVAAITERAMRGELAFAPALRERVAALKGLPETDLARVKTERVRLNPGAAQLIGALRRAGALTALVSGGFDDIVREVARDAGFDRFRANRLTISAGALTGEVTPPILGAEEKAAYLRELAAETGATPAQTVAMGDGANDVPLLRAAGFAIVVGGKPVALAEADAAVREGDLSAAADFLGLASPGFTEL